VYLCTCIQQLTLKLFAERLCLTTCDLVDHRPDFSTQRINLIGHRLQYSTPDYFRTKAQCTVIHAARLSLIAPRSVSGGLAPNLQWQPHIDEHHRQSFVLKFKLKARPWIEMPLAVTAHVRMWFDSIAFTSDDTNKDKLRSVPSTFPVRLPTPTRQDREEATSTYPLEPWGHPKSPSPLRNLVLLSGNSR
jgi:hypothetical protein